MKQQQDTALLALEFQFWLNLSSPFWYDLGYTHPLFAPGDYHCSNDHWWNPCDGALQWESEVVKQQP